MSTAEKACFRLALYEINFGEHWFVSLMTDFLTPKNSIRFSNDSPSTWPLFSIRTYTLVILSVTETEQGWILNYVQNMPNGVVAIYYIY